MSSGLNENHTISSDGVPGPSTLIGSILFELLIPQDIISRTWVLRDTIAYILL